MDLSRQNIAQAIFQTGFFCEVVGSLQSSRPILAKLLLSHGNIGNTR